MKRLVCMLLCLAAFGMAEAQRLTSPDGGLSLDFHLSPDGVPVYSLRYKGKTVIGESRMGFRIAPDYEFDRGFEQTDVRFSETDSVWQPVWGQYRDVRDRHKEMCVAL